jgi:hypothetical protein
MACPLGKKVCTSEFYPWRWHWSKGISGNAGADLATLAGISPTISTFFHEIPDYADELCFQMYNVWALHLFGIHQAPPWH